MFEFIFKRSITIYYKERYNILFPLSAFLNEWDGSIVYFPLYTFKVLLNIFYGLNKIAVSKDIFIRNFIGELEFLWESNFYILYKVFYVNFS